MEAGKVEYSISAGVAGIQFQHPQSNSLPGNLLRELAATIAAVSALEDAKVIILRSEGNRAFCAGASFDELIAIQNEEEGLRFFSGFAHVINAIRKSDKLIIGRIQGKTVGGGVGLASACDYAIATEAASIKLSELAVGIGPFVVGPAVERKIGLSAMSELAIDATEWRSAQWAQQKGLYNQVFATEEEMDLAIVKLSETLAASSPDAMRELKRAFWSGTEDWDQLLIDRAMISGRLVLSDFTKEAIGKFKKK